MNSKDEMKIVRNWLRRQMKLIRKDPYLPLASRRVEASIIKWNPREHAILVKIRDTSKFETFYNSNSTRWVWTYTYSWSYKWDIWKELNSMVNAAEHPDEEHYPF